MSAVASVSGKAASGRPASSTGKPVSLVAMQVVQEALKEAVELGALAQLAAADPGFAARVVSTVNSGAFGLSRQVSDVRQACSLLGIRGVRNLALSLVVNDMIPMGAEGTVLLAVSLRRAVSARLLAEALSEKELDEHFTTGLFLEIGLLQSARGDLKGSAEIARMPALHRPTYERACGREEHPHAGAELARSLQLPAPIVEAVAGHHAPAPPAAGPAGRIAWAAERIAGAFEGGDPQRTREEALSAAKAIGIAADRAAQILEQVPALVNDAARGFDRDVPTQESLDALVADANRRLVEMNAGYEKLIHQLEQLLSEKEALTEQLQRANQELASVAATDPLTGVPNRRAFEEALERDLARALRSGTSLTFLILDVDFFKKVNDTYGHPTGDVVLKAVAEVLKTSLRTGDIPARLGGEEFVALLPNSDAEGGRVVAERIRTTLGRTKMTGPKGPFIVTASFGVAAVQGAACKDAATTLMSRADAALYQAKQSGRNRVIVAE